ncbi:MAG TPA: alkaline phosphatase family protein [Thermoanaerobaculia bacterium]
MRETRKRGRATRATVLLSGLSLVLMGRGGSAAKPGDPPRVVVLGFDGVDAHIVESMLAAGRLPNLAALKQRGGYSPLIPTIPAQTPVSWATFSTGLDPGGHEIFDFLKRNPADRIPTFAVAEDSEVPLLFGRSNPVVFAAGLWILFALAGAGLFLARRRVRPLVVCDVIGLVFAAACFFAVKAWLPSTRPFVKNNRKGETFWSVPGGRPATVMRVPVTFPPDSFAQGHLLSGLGVPDLSGRIGKPFFFTSDPFFTPREGNDFSIELVRLDSNTGHQVTRIAGPPGKLFGREGSIELPLALTVPESRDRLIVEVSGEKRELLPGQWSDWVSLKFRVNPLISVSGYGRFLLEHVNPEIALYLSPLQFDPERLPPGLAISFPADFAPSLVREFGRYKTMGWAIDTWSIQSGTLPEKGFLEDVAATVDSDRRMLTSLLKKKDRLLFHYFEFPDRVAHVFWRLRDPSHPAYDAKLAQTYGDAVEKSYETMDAIVGETAGALSPDDVLIVLSDHGFASWRRSVNYNSWLVDNGYLVLKGDARRKSLEELFSRGRFWEAVDWSKSRMYSMGFGDLYVNLKGRESEGIVSPGPEYESVRAEVAQKLLGLQDPKTGELAVSRVFKREDIYRRFNPNLIPDLIVSNRPGYRVSWQSTLGVPTQELFEDNKDVWSGDHCSLDPDLVRGVLFASRSFRAEPVPHIADVTASVRKLFGAPPVADAAGQALW